MDEGLWKTFTLLIIIKQSLEYQRRQSISFIDFVKAFDNGIRCGASLVTSIFPSLSSTPFRALITCLSAAFEWRRVTPTAVSLKPVRYANANLGFRGVGRSAWQASTSLMTLCSWKRRRMWLTQWEIGTLGGHDRTPRRRLWGLDMSMGTTMMSPWSLNNT